MLKDLLREWVEDFLGSSEVKPDSWPASSRHAVPFPAPVQDPFMGTRLAFGGLLSIQRTPGNQPMPRAPAPSAVAEFSTGMILVSASSSRLLAD